MPRVPLYDTPQVAPQNLPNVELTAPRDLMQAMEAGPQQLQQFGSSLQGLGSDVAKIAADMQAKQNEADAKAGDISAVEKFNDLQYNPDTGYMTKQGKAAVDAYPDAINAIRKAGQDSLAGITNLRARELATPAINARMASAIESVQRHAGQQQVQYQAQTSDARAMASLQDAANNYGDDLSFWRAIGTAKSEAEAQAKIHGWDDATTRLQAQKYIDTGFKLRYDAWRMQDPAAALASFWSNAGAISPLNRVQIGHQIFEAAAPALASQLNAAGGAGIVPPATSPDGSANPLPRGVRNNNPGNIMRTDTPWQGEVQGNDPRYASFESPEAGIRAMGKNLLAYQDQHGLNTVEGIVARWAPATENDTAAYASAVSKALGVKPGQPIDLHDPATLTNLTKAMIQVENGQQPYSNQQISLGLAAATGAAKLGDASPTPTPAAAASSPRAALAYRDPAIPTGNALVDSLPSDWKMHVLQLARTQAHQVMTEAREQLKDKVQDAQASYLANGYAPNPPSEAEFINAFGQGEGVVRYRAFQDTAKLGQQLQQVKTLPAADLDQLRQGSKPEPGDGFAVRQHNYEILTNAIDRVQQARQQDPVAYALLVGNYGIKPITSSDPKAIAQELANRADAAPRIAADYGTAPAILTKAETKVLSDGIKAAPVEQQKNYLAAMYGSIGDMSLFKQVMQNIAPDNPTMAVAGMYQARGLRTTQDRDVADLILRGQAILTPNKKEDGSGHEGGQSLVKMPENKLLSSEFNSQAGDAFKGKEQANDLFYQTAKAIYAARSAEEGDYSGNLASSRWKSAISLATGGIEGHNGAKIVLPYGMAYDTFQDTLKTRVDALVKSSPPVAASARDLMSLPLENIGDGRYIFHRGAGYVVDSNGRPLVVDVNPAPSSATVGATATPTRQPWSRPLRIPAGHGMQVSTQ